MFSWKISRLSAKISRSSAYRRIFSHLNAMRNILSLWDSANSKTTLLHTADADTLEYKSIGKATKLREIPRLNSLQNSDFIYSPDGNDGLLVICDVNLRETCVSSKLWAHCSSRLSRKDRWKISQIYATQNLDLGERLVKQGENIAWTLAAQNEWPKTRENN